MKKIAAFFTATVLFLIIAVCMHFFVAGNLAKDSLAFGRWINPYKDLSYSAISKNIDEDTLVVFGSSEFQHGRHKKYHPSAVFSTLNKNIMCIGAAYNQSLSHAITLGAIAPKIKTKQVVLILSPAWFDAQGVKPNGFGVRFSESMYQQMLQNDNIPKDIKLQIAKRSEKLLVDLPSKYDNVKRINSVLITSSKNPIIRLCYRLKQLMLNEKEIVNINAIWRFSGKKETKKDALKNQTIDFPNMIKEFDEKYKHKATNNKFFIRNNLFTQNFKPVLNKQKDSMLKRVFPTTSPEYKDLNLFLEVAKANDIKVSIILLPINGYWYDFTGFDKARRDVLPSQIKNVLDGYDVRLYSFFDHDYDKGFLEDAFHPAGKGWMMINEKINEIYDNAKGKN